MVSNPQLALVHLAWKQAGLNEQQYRVILHNVAGCDSSKQLTQVDFENVMAVLEDSGFEDRMHGPTHWRDKVSRRGSLCGERVVRKIEELAGQQRYALARLCERFSGKRTDQVSRLRPREASNLIEMLKAVIARGGACVEGCSDGL